MSNEHYIISEEPRNVTSHHHIEDGEFTHTVEQVGDEPYPGMEDEGTYRCACNPEREFGSWNEAVQHIRSVTSDNGGE